MKYIEYINKRNALNYLCNIAYERGLSVNNLIDGIADKGNVSRMRNGKSKTTLDIIMFLAKRLDVNLEDVLRNSSSTDPDFFEAVDSIRYYSQIQDFNACKFLLKKTENDFSDEILKSIEVAQLIYWHKAIVTIELDKDIYSAIDLLNNALKLNNKYFSISDFNPKDYSDTELGIVNAILICHFKIDNSNTNIKRTYEKIIDYLDNKPINDHEVAFDIYYEYLIVCIKQKLEISTLLDIANNTLQFTIAHCIPGKQPFIYYQTALLYIDDRQYDKAEELFNYTIFMLRQVSSPEKVINSVIEVKHKCLGK